MDKGEAFLLDIPFHRWTYEKVDAFLSSRVPEDERIEYKERFDDTLQDTLVSFSNGDGGYIFVGVSEVKERKIPLKWPLLDEEKDHLRTAYNKAGAETSPPIRPIVHSFVDRATGKQLLVIKVDQGANPPYFAKNRGVKVRVGDADVHADPRMLELLFSRRRPIETVRKTHRRELEESLIREPVRNNERAPMRFTVYLAPLYQEHTVTLGRAVSNVLAGLMKYHQGLGHESKERREDEWVGFSARSSSIQLWRDATIIYRTVLSNDTALTQQPEPLDIVKVGHHLRGTLELAAYAYPQVIEYAGPLYTGVAITSIGVRPIRFPGHPLDEEPRKNAEVTPVDVWLEDGIEYRVGDNSAPVARQLLESLCWRLGYDNLESLFEHWSVLR